MQTDLSRYQKVCFIIAQTIILIVLGTVVIYIDESIDRLNRHFRGGILLEYPSPATQYILSPNLLKLLLFYPLLGLAVMVRRSPLRSAMFLTILYMLCSVHAAVNILLYVWGCFSVFVPIH